MKRHIGKIFEFNCEDYVFYGLCVYYDETFGYLLRFSLGREAIQENLCATQKNDSITLDAFTILDALIRRKQAFSVDKVLGFKPFFPPLRGGGGKRPDGTLKSFMIYDEAGWRPVDRDDPVLPSLSVCRILGIGTIKDLFVSGMTRMDVFNLEQPVY